MSRLRVPAILLSAIIGSVASVNAQTSEHGEITIVLDGESRTLPVIVPPATADRRARLNASRWLPPFSKFDSPRGTTVMLIAGAPVYSGEPHAVLTIDFDRNTRQVIRGANTVVDSRVYPDNAFTGDAAAASTLNFTIDEYEVREGSAFVRGSFADPEFSMTGTFSALVPALCGPAPSGQDWGEPTPSAEGCYPCEKLITVYDMYSLDQCRPADSAESRMDEAEAGSR